MTFKLKNDDAAPQPFVFEPESKTQQSFISGRGTDLPGQRLLCDVDFEGEADPISTPGKGTDHGN